MKHITGTTMTLDTATSNPLPARVIYYYVNASRWLSDLEFFRIEVAFFQGLLEDQYFRFTDDRDDCQKLKGLKIKFGKLEKEIEKYSLQVQDYLDQIAQAAEYTAEQQEELAAGQVVLEARMPRLTSEYRQTKRQMFALAGKSSGKIDSWPVNRNGKY